MLGAGAKSLLVLAAVVVVLAGFRHAQPLIVPLVVAAFIAAATAPMVDWLGRRGLPSFVSVALAVLLVIGTVGVFGLIVTMAASDLTDALPRYEQALGSARLELARWLSEHELSRLARGVTRYDGVELAEGVLRGVVLQAPSTISAASIVLFVVLFILLEAATFRTKLHRALNWRSDRLDDLRAALTEVQKYLLVKSLISAATGMLCGIWCFVAGVDNAVLWALLAFALNFVPIFGSAIVTLLATGVATLDQGLYNGIFVFTGFLAVNNVLGNVVEPKVLGRALGLSPLVVTVAIVVWVWVLGPVGALISAPLTMVFKILAAHTTDLRWIAVLLGPGEGKPEEDYLSEREQSRQQSASLASSPTNTQPGSAA
jgi:predicted PurR-regulated permease PerM